MKEEKNLVFINELDHCLCQSPNQEKEFLFRSDDKFSFTTDLEIAFKISNRITNIPHFVSKFCTKHNLRVREVLTTYKLIIPENESINKKT